MGPSSYPYWTQTSRGAAQCMGDVGSAQMQVTCFRKQLLSSWSVLFFMAATDTSGCLFVAAFRLLELKKIGRQSWFRRTSNPRFCPKSICSLLSALNLDCPSWTEYDKLEFPYWLYHGGYTTSLSLTFLLSIIGVIERFIQGYLEHMLFIEMLMVKPSTKEIFGNHEPLTLHSLFIPLVPNPHSVKGQEKALFCKTPRKGPTVEPSDKRSPHVHVVNCVPLTACLLPTVELATASI